MPSDADRIQTLRHALQQIAAGPCTGRVPGCRYPLAARCPKHMAEAALTDDDWLAPLDQPEWDANRPARHVDPSLPCGYCCNWRDGDVDKDEFGPVVIDEDGNDYDGPLSEPHPECLKSVELYMAELKDERRRTGVF